MSSNVATSSTPKLVKKTGSPGPKKVIKRRPNGGAAPKDYYFNDNTQRAIVEWKAETDEKRKTDLYMNEILPAFMKLVENLINVYGFRVQYESKADLQNECIEFLYGVISKFDPSKGTKAFAYFNVVAKHWLIVKAKQSSKITHAFTSIDDHENLSPRDLETIENHHVAVSPEEKLLDEHNSQRLGEILEKLSSQAVSDNEKQAMSGVVTLFQNAENLDFLNKRAVMVYLRELTAMNPKTLGSAISSLKKSYKTIKQELASREERDGDNNE